MPNSALPIPIQKYFAAKGADRTEEALDCFTDDAAVWDNGEDIELKGIAQIREWIAGSVAGYKLTSDVKSIEKRVEQYVALVVVSGDFLGSPYEFEYRFKLDGDKIAELAIDPIGSLA